MSEWWLALSHCSFAVLWDGLLLLFSLPACSVLLSVWFTGASFCPELACLCAFSSFASQATVSSRAMWLSELKYRLSAIFSTLFISSWLISFSFGCPFTSMAMSCFISKLSATILSGSSSCMFLCVPFSDLFASNESETKGVSKQTDVSASKTFLRFVDGGLSWLSAIDSTVLPSLAHLKTILQVAQ